MSLKSKYFNEISVKSTKKTKNIEEKHPCAFQGCDKPGKYKAPIQGEDTNNYTFFCLEHVQEYNKNYNFFEDLPEDKKQKFLHTKTTEEFIPISKLSLGESQIDLTYNTIRSGSAAYQRRVGNNLKIYGSNDKAKQQRKLTALEMQAFETLDLPYDANSDAIKIKYKSLVKINHPDANKGDRSYEERFNAILTAYKQLKKNGLV